MLSSRKLEVACQEQIVFMALTCGQRPDHSTIAEFVSGIAANKRMDHSTLRGTVKVNIQWKLYCLVHNLEKITRFSPGKN